MTYERHLRPVRRMDAGLRGPRAQRRGSRAKVEAHLEGCGYCLKRYRFEESLRIFVREVCAEEMAPELKAKLAALRTPL